MEIPTDPASDLVLGIQKHHLPDRFRHFFLPDDIILFKHRTFLEIIKSRKDMPIVFPNPNIPDCLKDPLRQCEFCAIDVLCAWVVAITLAGVSIPIGLVALLTPSILSTIIFIITSTIQLLALYFILSRSPIPLLLEEAAKTDTSTP